MIKTMDYKTLEFDETQILHLYNENNWTSYTEDTETLFTGIHQSLYSYAAYDDNKLVGLIRVVGDGQTIIYIQDILVLPEYRRQGIGRLLMTHVLNKYQHVRQILLTTIVAEAQQRFYESLGFVPYNSLDLVGFYYKK